MVALQRGTTETSQSVRKPVKHMKQHKGGTVQSKPARAAPGCAPSSITCSLDVSTPPANVFCAKLITVLPLSAPGACRQRPPKALISRHSRTLRRTSPLSAGLDTASSRSWELETALAPALQVYKCAGFSTHLQRRECRCVRLQRLAAFLVHRVQLHVSLHKRRPARTHQLVCT